MAERPPSAEQKARDLNDQMNDLGTKRRDNISTAEYKENKAAFRPVRELERLRQSRQVSEGYRAPQGLSKLNAWNNVYVQLEDDGTVQEQLSNVNEGLGQTHRARLLSDHTPNNRGRGNAAHHSNSHVNHTEVGRPAQLNNGPNERRLGGHVASNPVVSSGAEPFDSSTRRQRTARGALEHQGIVRPLVASTSESFNRQTRAFEVRLASPADFMESVQGRIFSNAVSRTPSHPNIDTVRTPEAPSSPAPLRTSPGYPNVHHDPDAGQLDSGQSSVSSDLEIEPQDQPSTVQTHSTDADDRATMYSLLTDEQKEVLRRLQAQRSSEPTSTSVQAPARAISPPPTSAPAAPISVREVTQSAPISPPVIFTPEPENIRLVSPPVGRTARLEFAEKRANQRETIIGEHVAKTRFHPAAASENLANDFERLRISDEPQAPLIEKSVNVPLENKPPVIQPPVTKKATSNPFGGSEKGSSRSAGPSRSARPSRSAGPSLPLHLMNVKPSTDPGAAARAQYGNGQDPLDRKRGA